MKPMKRAPRGFTLTEMLVVVAIIAVLAGIAYPVSRSFVDKSREATCLGKVRAMGTGLQSYLQDHNNTMPDLANGRASKTEDLPVLDTVLLPYLSDSAEAFHCPADDGVFAKSGCSYTWNASVSGKQVTNLYFFNLPEGKIPMIGDKDSDWHPNKSNVLFADFSSGKIVLVANP